MRESFVNWIDEVGPVELARRLGVTRQAVYHWRKRKGYPSVEQIKKILAMAGGRLTFDLIVGKRGAR